MATDKLTAAVFLILISAQAGNGVVIDDEQQQQCSVDDLPEFGDIYTTSTDRPSRDRFQAIVPAYTFNCTGRVTEWRACLHPGATTSKMYYIQFQVWRPTGIGGCYELVDYNIPLDDAGQEEMNISDSNVIIEAEGFLSPPGDSNDPLHRCVVLPVRESQQIEFQPGDVVGYYVDYFRNRNDDRTEGGIQWIDSTAVTVYYKDNIARVGIKTQYALFPIELSSCGFQVSSTGNSHYLTQTAASAPIISLSFTTTVMLTSTVVPLLTSTSPPPGPAVTSTSTSPPPGPAVTSTSTSPPPGPAVTSTSTSPPPGPAVTSTSTSPPPGPAVTSTSLTTISVTLSSSMTIIQPEMSPSVPPPASPPCVSQDGNTASIVLAITIAAIVTTVVISVLVWLKRRKKKESELVDNVAYHSQNMELKTNPNSAYNAVSTVIPTTTNEAYGSTDIPTSPNTAYEVVQATADDVDTKPNAAYAATGIATSVNEAYQPVQSTSHSTPVYDYPYAQPL